MLSNTLIESLHMDVCPKSRNYLIIEKLLKLYSKTTNCILINLYNLNNIYDTFGWYYDKENANLFHVCVIIDSNNVYTKDNNNSNVLKSLKLTSYTKLCFYLKIQLVFLMPIRKLFFKNQSSKIILLKIRLFKKI